MLHKLILTSLALLILFPQGISLAATDKVHACRTAWNDQMKEYDDEYAAGLNNLLFHKTTTSAILDSGTVTYNLRSHNCNMYQVCEAVRTSLGQEEGGEGNIEIHGKFMRCAPRPLSEFGNILANCAGLGIKSQQDTASLWSQCFTQAEERILNVETVTEAEVVKSSSAKKTGNLVGYLINLNTKLNQLALDFGEMIGVLFAVTREITCVQKTCS